jgi:hypothetical protein
MNHVELKHSQLNTVILGIPLGVTALFDKVFDNGGFKGLFRADVAHARGFLVDEARYANV